MGNEENISHIVRGERAITRFSLTCKIYSMLIYNISKEAKRNNKCLLLINDYLRIN